MEWTASKLPEQSLSGYWITCSLEYITFETVAWEDLGASRSLPTLLA